MSVTFGDPGFGVATREARAAGVPGDRALLSDFALLLVALSSGLGSLRLTTKPTAAHLVLSVMATVVAGHTAVSVVERVRMLRARQLLSCASGIGAVALVAAWVTVPSAARHGIPTPTTVRAVLHLFAEAGAVIRAHPTPLAPAPGVVLCLVTGAGLASATARVLWSWAELDSGRSTAALVALVPTFGLFAYCSVLSSGVDRVPGSLAYVGTASVFLVVSDRARAQGPRSSGFRRSGMAAGMATGALVLVVCVVLSPALTGMKLDAFPYSAPAVSSSGGGTGVGDSTRHPPGAPAPGVGPLSLMDDLHAVLTTQSDEVMFDARTTVPTYWQLATLSTFTGAQWIADPGTEAAAAGSVPLEDLPLLPTLPQPSGGATFSVDVSLVDLVSTLLPVPPTTLSVSGNGARLVAPVGALSRSPRAGVGSSQAGLSYSAVARVPNTQTISNPPSSAGSTTASAPSSPSVDASALAPYTTLPDAISPAVVALAHEIVSGISDQLAKAQAIERWFEQGQFRYTLNPPQDPGTDPLSAFLFDTKAGFCQQFAGAFAVLARLDGLPTRLGVGFATGTLAPEDRSARRASSFDSYTITGADAHVWPEVYLGPSDGWVSFEPTPPVSGEPDGTGVFEGSSVAQPSGTSPTTSTTVASKHETGPSSAPRRSTARTGSGVDKVMLEVVLGFVAIGVAILVVSRFATPFLERARRNRRGSRARGGVDAPDARDQEVLARLERVWQRLSGAGCGRRDTETLEEHLDRLRSSWPTRPESLDAYEALVRLAERASYSSDPCTDEQAGEAVRLCESVLSSIDSIGSTGGKGRTR